VDTFQHLLAGLTAATSLQNLGFALIGCFLGTLIGVLPGLGPAAGTAILIPLTFTLDPIGALIMLSAIYYGAMYGGTITSVLINVPGEAASVATCFDGYQMAKQGRGGTALGIAAIGSFVGGIAATVALIVVAPPLARIALSFGPPEFFALMLVGLCLITGLAGQSLLTGLVMAVLGLLIAMVGIDPVRGAPRFTFGIPSLYDGVGFIPVVMGLFGIAEILLTIEAPYRQVIKTKLTSLLPSREEWRRSFGAIARGTGIGFFLGLIPGVGAIIPTFVAAGAVRPRRHRGRGRTRDGQQRLRQRGDDPIADARHPELADHRGADGRLHHQRPDARSLPVQGASRPGLGGDRKLHGRQRHPVDLESAVRGLVGALAAAALSVRVRRDAAVLCHRRL
jgi:putative tricarboxylic transport membrane protein